MKLHAAGTFDVELRPQAPTEGVGDPAIKRMAISKRFSGGLDATSAGEMLAGHTGIEGSAGYVAMERVLGLLDGRHGAFVLAHLGTMDRGTPKLTIVVVPDSGTDELKGLSGSMDITIVDDVHSYVFDYTLPRLG